MIEVLFSTGKQSSESSTLTGGEVSHLDNKKAGEESVKRRKLSSAKTEPDGSIASDEFFMASPCLVTLSPGVRITTVAAGGRHTLALSGNSAMSWVSGAHILVTCRVAASSLWSHHIVL